MTHRAYSRRIAPDYSFRLMIVVTGSTGRVGGLVARRLELDGHWMRLLVRDPNRCPGVVTEFADEMPLAATRSSR